MSQFDVHTNPSRMGHEDRPFLLVVQTRFLDLLRTRVCAPLLTERALQREPRLNPLLAVNGRAYYLSATELVALPLRLLGKPVANLEDQRYEIIAALDLVFLGI